MEHHEGDRNIYEGDVGSAWEWRQIKFYTSCVSAALNQLGTIVFDASRSISTPTVVK